MIKEIGISEDGMHSCYQIISRTHRLTMAGLYSILGKTVAVAYMRYTNQWYAYNPDTGIEIATFSKDYYDDFIKPLKVYDLIEDKDCICKHSKAA